MGSNDAIFAAMRAAPVKFSGTKESRKGKDPIPAGHVAPPGSGPEGETCGSCEHVCPVRLARKTVYKCGKAKHRWTGGRATDIRLKDAACVAWERESG